METNQPFRLTDDASADWAVRKIREAREDTALWQAHFEAQMDKIKRANEETETYFTGLLAAWFQDQPKRETKTLSRYSLPSADLVRRKQAPEFLRNDAVLADFLLGNGLDEFIERVPRPKWAELKKRCVVGPDGSVADAETGLLLQGVTAEARPDKFEVKIREAGFDE